MPNDNRPYDGEFAQRTNDAWMQSYTGKQLFIFEPERSKICIEDIAHSLSYICRYGGHCTRFYSVAQHSFLVAELMLRHVSGMSIPFREACDMVKAALLHDAAEYVLGDILRPLKHSGEMETYIRLEDRWEHAIFTTFGIEDIYRQHKALIKKFDWVLLATERRDLMTAVENRPWTVREAPMEEKIDTVSIEVVEELFLHRFRSMSY